MIKPILINSYPRSGSVFLAEILRNLLNRHDIEVLHLPELIGINEAISITIIRDPKQCISSNIFKWLITNDLPKDISNLDSIIKSECEYYIKFLKMSKLKKSYLINFKNLILDTENEVTTFLKEYKIYQDFILNIENILKNIEKKNFEDNRNDLYGGHFPRDVNKNPEYIKIWEYINNNYILNEACTMYDEILKEI